MTNYNDGKWHGWNGEECPVHPKTEVEVAFFDGVDRTEAGCFSWVGGAGHSIIAFRVVKEHREPREFWITIYDGMAWDYESQAIRHNESLGDNAGHITRVREVLPD